MSPGEAAVAAHRPLFVLDMAEWPLGHLRRITLDPSASWASMCTQVPLRANELAMTTHVALRAIERQTPERRKSLSDGVPDRYRVPPFFLDQDYDKN